MMDISILLQQESPVPSHAIMAMSAIAIGGVQFATPKGTLAHKALGYLWVGLMSGVALSALFIHRLRVWGPFSPIHLLVPLLFYSLWRAMSAIRKGEIARHKREMVSLYIYALIVTGFFTFLPGRAMHLALFGG